MRELLVISGKGGTGKTSIVGAFAALASGKVLADCDVDAADLHLLLHPDVEATHEFRASRVARVDRGLCIQCGLCAAACRFGAVSSSPTPSIDAIACEGCGVCAHICPQGAVYMEEVLSGHWFVSKTDYGPMVHARLGPAQENSGRLVAKVRQAARGIAEQAGLDLIITDGPPGIGCPVLSALTDTDLALIVAEPTVAGVHDLARVVDTARHFGAPVAVCINKHDLNNAGTDEIRQYCRREGLPIAGVIPFDRGIVEALVRGQPATEAPIAGPALERLCGETLGLAVL